MASLFPPNILYPIAKDTLHYTQWHGSLSDGVCHKMTNPIFRFFSAWGTLTLLLTQSPHAKFLDVIGSATPLKGLLLRSQHCIIDRHTPRRQVVGGCGGIITPDFSYTVFFLNFAFYKNRELHIAKFAKTQFLPFWFSECEAWNGKLRFPIPL